MIVGKKLTASKSRIVAGRFSGGSISPVGTLPADFDFTNGGNPLTALPAILTALNAAYTRNSVKNVVQNGALVALSANQFGTSYDSVAGLYGYVPEPAATNLATNSDGNAATYTSANIVDGTAVPGFTNGIAFGDNSVLRYAYKQLTLTAATAYTCSFFIIMDDGGVPVVGNTNTTGDLSVICDNNISPTNITVRHIGGSLYRVSGSIASATGGATRNCGAVKYTGQSARTFRITGIQVETGLRATSYIATTGSTASRSADVLTVPLWINNVKDSQDGSTANWTRTNCTVTTSGTAPDGTATAQLLTVSSTASTLFVNTSCKAPAKSVTYSVYVRAGNRTTAVVQLRNQTTATTFTGGVLTYATGAITGTGWEATNVGSGWFRCTYTSQAGDTISVGDTLYGYAHFTGSSFTIGDTAYFWGAQIEPGSVATAYRPTTSTLESAANANITGFSSAGYTLAVDQRMDTTLAASTTALSISAGASADRAYLEASSGITAGAQSAATAGNAGLITMGAIGLSRARYAASYTLNNLMGARSGIAGTPDTSVTMPIAPTTLSFCSYNNVTQYNGYIFRAQLIPTPLTQAQLNGLTT